MCVAKNKLHSTVLRYPFLSLTFSPPVLPVHSGISERLLGHQTRRWASKNGLPSMRHYEEGLPSIVVVRRGLVGLPPIFSNLKSCSEELLASIHTSYIQLLVVRKTVPEATVALETRRVLLSACRMMTDFDPHPSLLSSRYLQQ
jgi:hypothetical protein